jgi:capsular polysaccharide biosynthesis protein
MGLIELLKIIKKKIWLIVIIAVMAAAVGAAYSIYMTTPVYAAKSKLIVTRVQYSQEERLNYSDVLMYQMLVKTYSELAKSKPVISETISKLGYGMNAGELAGGLTITSKEDVQVIEIEVQNINPQRACELANTLSEVFIEKARALMNTDDVKMMERAEVPEGSVSPNIPLNITISFLLGAMLSTMLVLLLEYLDNTIKTEDDVEKCLAMTVLATIPYENKRKRKDSKSAKVRC